MEKLLRWTVYLMIFFIISVLLYFYSWWSFEPKKKDEFVFYDQNYTKFNL
tara:strand:- start:62 stop:211 length:150 start_codon:yes stop_codon:yes gene_type:complete